MGRRREGWTREPCTGEALRMWWDSNGVNASPTAYALGVPDGPLRAIHYGVTLALAAVGGNRRTGRGRVWDVLLGGAVLGGVGAALVSL